MFGKSNQNKTQAIASLIGAGTSIEGNLSFSGGLRIDGMVKGNVLATDSGPSMLVISEQAKIEGEVHAAHLVVNGTVNGPIFAGTLIELQPRARIMGDVHYAAIEMHHGAVVDGRMVHINDNPAQLALPSPEKVSNKPTEKVSAKNTDKSAEKTLL